MGCFSIVGASGLDDLSLLVWCQLEIALYWYCYKPPGMVVKCPVIVSFVEFMNSDAKTTPKNPAFEIRFCLFNDQVVAQAKALRAYVKGEVKVRQNDSFRWRTSGR